jgi:hypothetical protein
LINRIISAFILIDKPTGLKVKAALLIGIILSVPLAVPPPFPHFDRK